MRLILRILPILILLGCKERNNKNDIPTAPVTDIETQAATKSSNAESREDMNFDPTKIAAFTVEDSEFSSAKAMTGKLSDYSRQELRDLPEYIRLTISIVVPFDITKESLENTFKSIVYDETEKNYDIDEILIFAFDDKDDIGKGYTYGKLFWGPEGKTGNVTADIARYNSRLNYSSDIVIKDKVGQITKSDLPTKREQEIYYEIMSEEYWGMTEEETFSVIMRKFNIKTVKELKNIHIKVARHKYN